MTRPVPPYSRLLAAVFALTLLLLLREVSLYPRGRFVVHFLDVGQGDGALLVSPSGKQILIDGGPDFSALEGLGRTMPFFDRSIDLLVLSHPQLDHMRAFPEILRRYAVRGVLMTGVLYDLPQYEEFLALLKEKRTPLIIADPGKDLAMGDGLTLDILWPPPALFGKAMKEVNNSSIALRALFGPHTVLFTGDMEESEEWEILASGADVRADVIKVPHHGSRTSSSTGFLLEVQPSLAVISVGRDNRYGHPHKDVLARYASLGIPVRTTAQEGRITLRFSSILPE